MPKSTTPSRSELRKREFQQKITRAAITLFAENGVNETPITAIIEKAGIAHKTFFNHFPSKNDLLFHIADMYSEYSDLIFDDYIGRDMEPADKIECSFMDIATGISSLKPNDIVMFKHILTGVQPGPESAAQQSGKLATAIGSILNEARDQNSLQPGITLETYNEMIVGLFTSAIFSWASQQHYPLEAKMRRMVAFIRHSVFID